MNASNKVIKNIQHLKRSIRPVRNLKLFINKSLDLIVKEQVTVHLSKTLKQLMNLESLL